MPPWAWTIVISVAGLMGGLIYSAAKFGVSAGKLSYQLDTMTKALSDLKVDFKDETRGFRAEIHQIARSLAVYEERLTHVEGAIGSPRQPDDRRMRTVTPAFGAPAVASKSDDDGDKR